MTSGGRDFSIADAASHRVVANCGRRQHGSMLTACQYSKWHLFAYVCYLRHLYRIHQSLSVFFASLTPLSFL